MSVGVFTEKAARNIMAFFDNSMIISYKIWFLSIPAAGNCEDGKVNNVGINGNVWASALNSENVKNAWNFNFNSDKAGVNNNNRYNGQSVRGVVGQMTEITDETTPGGGGESGPK